MRAVLVLLCVAGVAVRQCYGVLPAMAASSVMDLGQSYPTLTRAISTIKYNDPELADFLGDKDSVCTFLAPTNQALAKSAASLGKYAGKAAQDTDMVRSTLRQHVIRGKALTATQLGRLGRALTAANETLYTWKQGDKDFVYARRDYPIFLNKTDIKAGKCIVHTIDMALVPPTYQQQVAAWLDQLGTWPPKGPKSQWAPEQEPLPDSREATTLPATPAAAASPAGAAGAVPAPVLGKSSSGALPPPAGVLVTIAASACTAALLLLGAAVL